MANERAMIPETIFITYDGIIKDYRPFILKKIAEIPELTEAYRGFINVDILQGLTIDQLNFLSMISPSRNILEFLAIKQFDYEKALNDIYNKFPEMYIDSELLSFGQSLNILKRQSFTKKIYIYTENYDKRIHFDIQNQYKDMNLIEYITGPFEDVMKTIDEHITTFVLYDIAMVDKLIELKKIHEAHILIPDIAFNYKMGTNGAQMRIDDIEKKCVDNIFRIASFAHAKNITSIATDIINHTDK